MSQCGNERGSQLSSTHERKAGLLDCAKVAVDEDFQFSTMNCVRDTGLLLQLMIRKMGESYVISHLPQITGASLISGRAAPSVRLYSASAMGCLGT